MLTAARLAIAAVLAAAALRKLAEPRASIEAMGTFGFPEGPLRAVAWASLIGAEAILAVGLAAGSVTAAFLAAAALVLFGLLQVSALARGRAGAPCPCFGAIGRVSPTSAAATIALGGLCAALAIAES
ncbi:MAG: hypothetical protein U0R52_08915 [Solirubrobacterales bacterium]